MDLWEMDVETQNYVSQSTWIMCGMNGCTLSSQLDTINGWV